MIKFYDTPEAAVIAAGASCNISACRGFCGLHLVTDRESEDTYMLQTSNGYRWAVVAQVTKFRQFRWACILGGGIIYETEPSAGSEYCAVSFLPFGGDTAAILDHWDYSSPMPDEGYGARWTGFEDAYLDIEQKEIRP